MNKRQERYLRNREKELAAANKYYKEHKDTVLQAQRKKYQQNIEEERKKSREKQRKRRARLRQNDTILAEKTAESSQKDTKKQ